MRLLNPKEINSLRQKEQERDFLKGLKVSSFVTSQVKDLNQIKDKYESESQRIKSEFKALISGLKDQKDALLSEIDSLEQRRRAIEESSDEKHWKARHEAILRRETEIKEEESKLEQLSLNLLQEQKRIDERLDDLEAIQLDLDQRDREWNERNQKLILNEKEHERVVNECEARLRKKETLLDNKLESAFDREVRAKQLILGNEIIQHELTTQLKDLDKEREHLESQQHALNAAFAEARRKNIYG